MISSGIAASLTTGAILSPTDTNSGGSALIERVRPVMTHEDCVYQVVEQPSSISFVTITGPHLAPSRGSNADSLPRIAAIFARFLEQAGRFSIDFDIRGDQNQAASLGSAVGFVLVLEGRS